MDRLHLNLWELLSQAYIHYYPLGAALVLLKVVLFKVSLSKALELAINGNPLCTPETTEMLTQTARAVSHWLQTFFDHLKLVNMYFFTTVITIAKNLLIFAFEVLFGTYTCLLSALVDATANFALDAGETVVIGVNATIVAAAHGIEEGLVGLQGVLNDAADGLNGIKAMFTGGLFNTLTYVDAIQWSLDDLNNIKIPGKVLDDIELFRKNTLPDFTDVDDDVAKAIALPFDKIQSEIDKMFNSSVSLKAPVLEVTNPLCDIDFQNAIKDVLTALDTALKWVVVGLVLGVVAALCFASWELWCHWKRKQAQLRELYESPSDVGALNILYRYDNPLVYWFHRLGVVKSTVPMWMLEYCFSPYARTLLLLAIAGLLLVALQWLILHKSVSAIKLFTEWLQSTPEIANFKRDMRHFMDETNLMLILEGISINNGVIGHVREATGSLNTTINSIWSRINGTVNDIFGDVPVVGPVVSTVVYCTVGRKVDTIQRGLTWVHDNSVFKMATLDLSTLDGVASAVSEPDKLDLALKPLNKVVEIYDLMIMSEMYIALALLALWALQPIIGACLMLFHRWYRQPSAVEIPVIKREMF